MPSRTVPAMLWGIVGIAASAGATHGWLLVAAPGSLPTRWLQMSLHLLTAVAYAGATSICLKIAGDYRDRSTMRLAWRLIAASATVAVIRHCFEWLVLATGWNETRLTTLVSLRQIPIVVSLILLAAGLVAVWSSFTSIGMGLRFRGGDIVVLGIILAFVPSIFSLREEMSDAQSVYPIIRHLQSASPVLLAAPALVALALHRISREMGGGQLATSLRCLVAFLLMRLLALFLGSYPGVAAFTVASRTVWWSVGWLFLLAVFYRWRVTVSASELADRYEADPEAELAGVSRALALRSQGHPALQR